MDCNIRSITDVPSTTPVREQTNGSGNTENQSEENIFKVLRSVDLNKGLTAVAAAVSTGAFMVTGTSLIKNARSISGIAGAVAAASTASGLTFFGGLTAIDKTKEVYTAAVDKMEETYETNPFFRKVVDTVTP